MSNVSVIGEGVLHSRDIVEKSTEPPSTPAQEFVTLSPLPVETKHREAVADAPAESNLPVVEDVVSVGVAEVADAPAVGEPSIRVQDNAEQENPEAEVVEETVTPPASTDETAVPPPVPDTPTIEEGIPQAEFTPETHATPASDENGAEGSGSPAPLQAPTETIVAPVAGLDTPVVGDGIPQPDAAVEEPTSPIPALVEETVVEEPLVEIVAEESAVAVPTSAEGAGTVSDAPIGEEGISQAEVVAEGLEIPLSGPVEEIAVPLSAPAPAEEGIPQVGIVKDSVTPLPAPAEEVIVPLSLSIESDHTETVAVPKLPAAVPEASSEVSALPVVEAAAEVIGVEGPDHLVDEPLALVEKAQSAPVEIEGAEVDHPAWAEPVADKEIVTIVSVPTVESALTIPEAAKEAPVPAVTIGDLPKDNTPPVGAAADLEEENIGTLVEPEAVVAPEVPQAAAEPAIIEAQHAQDENPPLLVPEGETLPVLC